jgi:hypothetical protein
MANPLRVKRGTKASLPTLAAGELGFCTDTGELYIGTGSDNILVGGLTSGMTNPMTAAGDIIYGGTAGNPTRLAKGSDGQVLKLASGAPSWSWGGKLVQVQHATVTAAASGSTQMPADDTIPQKTEGNEYITLAITPKSAGNVLLILCHLVGVAPAGTATIALFQDDASDALCANGEYFPAADVFRNLTLIYSMASGTTSSTTFKIRFGVNASGTNRILSDSAGRRYGGVANCTMTIFEFAS